MIWSRCSSGLISSVQAVAIIFGDCFQDFYDSLRHSDLVIPFSASNADIYPEEHLDEIIERIKTHYIAHHLQDKSLRQTAVQCRLSRDIVKRIADKLALASTCDDRRLQIL